MSKANRWVLLLICGLTPGTSLPDDHAERLRFGQAVLAEWNQRYSDVTSAQILWNGKLQYRRGDLDDPVWGKPDPAKPHPPQDFMAGCEVEFIFQKPGQWRYTWNRDLWNPNIYAWQRVTQHHISDGTKVMTYFPVLGDTDLGSARITPPQSEGFLRSITAISIVMALPPLANLPAKGAVSPGAGTQLAGTMDVDGVACDILTEPLPQFGTIYNYWISKDERRLIRFQAIVKGKEKILINYAYNKKFGRVPARWRMTETVNQKEPRIRDEVVTEGRLNADIPSDSFVLRPAAGTVVSDPFSKDRSSTDLQVVKPDGSLRPFPPADFGASLEDIYVSEPGFAHTHRDRHRRLFWTASLIVIGAALVAAGWWIRRKRGRPR